MSLTGDRTAIAAALSTVEGVTGHAKRPGAPRTGDAWPLLGGLEHADGAAFTVTWRVLVALPSDEVAASDWLDAHVYDLVDALVDLGYVDQLVPVLVTIGNTDTHALQITMRSD